MVDGGVAENSSAWKEVRLKESTTAITTKW